MASNTYEAVGNRQDISDVLTNIAPYDTPLFSRIGRTRAIAVEHQWLEDTLGDPSANNAFPEGFTFFTEAPMPRVLLSNYTQIMSKGIHVTGTQEVVAKHGGITSEIAYQLQKSLKELALDCEKALLTQDTRDPGSFSDNNSTPSTPRKFGGLPYWIVTNVLENGGAARDLTFDLINNALEQTWMVGGKPSLLLVSARNKRIISSFTAGNVKYMEGNKEHRLSQMISVIETDFGVLQCMSDRWMDNDTVYGLSPEYIKKAFLRPFRPINLPKQSDAERKNVYGEWTLEMRAEKAHFAVKDLNGIIPAAA